MANRNIKIKYYKAHDFKTSLTTGIYGGVTPHGMINAHFFTDRNGLPDYETIELTDKGVQIGMPQQHKDGDFVREVQFGTLLDVATAKQVVDWLNQRIAEAEKNFPKN
jgi:hypothetical protein